MDLVCPHCQKRLNLEDRFAGAALQCPYCQATLQVPVLLTTPSASPTLPLAEPVATPAAAEPRASAAVATSLPVAAATPLEPPPPGDYSRVVRIHLRLDILEWIVPSALVLVFVLSLFVWYYREDYQLNLWQLAFTERGFAVYSLYTVVLVFVAIPLAIITLSLEKRWIPVSAGLTLFWPWRSLLNAGVVTLPFVFFLVDYVELLFLPHGFQATIVMKLAFRLHALAVLACALQIWLQRRQARGLPLPRLEFHW